MHSWSDFRMATLFGNSRCRLASPSFTKLHPRMSAVGPTISRNLSRPYRFHYRQTSHTPPLSFLLTGGSFYPHRRLLLRGSWRSSWHRRRRLDGGWWWRIWLSAFSVGCCAGQDENWWEEQAKRWRREKMGKDKWEKNRHTRFFLDGSHRWWHVVGCHLRLWLTDKEYVRLLSVD